MCAISNKFAGIINFLIFRGTDLTITNSHNRTAMDIAREKNLTRVATDLKFKISEMQKP